MPTQVPKPQKGQRGDVYGEADFGSQVHEEVRETKSSGADYAGVMPVNQPESAVNALREVLSSLKRPPDKKYFRGLCPAGILSIMVWLPTPDDQPTRIGVYDGLPLTLEMVKA